MWPICSRRSRFTSLSQSSALNPSYFRPLLIYGDNSISRKRIRDVSGYGYTASQKYPNRAWMDEDRGRWEEMTWVWDLLCELALGLCGLYGLGQPVVCFRTGYCRNSIGVAYHHSYLFHFFLLRINHYILIHPSASSSLGEHQNIAPQRKNVTIQNSWCSFSM